MKEICCICNEVMVKAPYVVIRHIGDSKSRTYTGHKSCLFLLANKLEKGEDIDFEEIELPI